MRRWEGQLNKFTNVVKGWQYRWFVLEPTTGMLEYYLLEDRSGKCRGSQHMAQAVVLPSQDDENTFTINFVSGEHYKVRASSARERQVWVDRLRHCIYLHSRQEEPGDLPDRPLSTLPLTSVDAFGSVHQELEKVYEKQDLVTKYISSLPVPKPGDTTSPSCHNSRLLVLKATSQAMVSCLESTTDILQRLAEHKIWLQGEPASL